MGGELVSRPAGLCRYRRWQRWSTWICWSKSKQSFQTAQRPLERDLASCDATAGHPAQFKPAHGLGKISFRSGEGTVMERDLYHDAAVLRQRRAAFGQYVHDGHHGYSGALLPRQRAARRFISPAPTSTAIRSPKRPPPTARLPKSYATASALLFRSTWDACGIAYDHFIRTTDAYHSGFCARASCNRSMMPAISISASMAAFIATVASAFTPRRNWSTASVRTI